jgi:hypothetical protein
MCRCSEKTTTTTTTTTADPDAPYYMGNLGSECATAEEIILSAAECEQALQQLGTPVSSISPTGWSGSDGGVPAGCSYRPGPDKCGHVSCLNSPNQVHFNSASSGNGRADLQPICKQATTTTTTDPSAPAWTCNQNSDIGVCLDGLEETETETEITDENEDRRECQKWCYAKKHANKPWEGRKCQWYACAACPECATATTTTTTDPSAPSWTCDKKSDIGVCLDGLNEIETPEEITCEVEDRRECKGWCYSKKNQKKPWKTRKCEWYACAACPECATPVPTPAPTPGKMCLNSCHRGDYIKKKSCQREHCADCCECTG